LLSRAEATSSVVSRDRFDEALGDAIEDPAIGAALPFDDLLLPDRLVTLDPTPDELRAAKTGVTGAPIGITAPGTVAV
jgi:hypothetical protein